AYPCPKWFSRIRRAKFIATASTYILGTLQVLHGSKAINMHGKEIANLTEYHMQDNPFKTTRPSGTNRQKSNFYQLCLYWMYKFRDPSMDTSNNTNSTRTDLQIRFPSTCGVVNNVSTIISIAFTLLCLEKISHHRKMVATLYLMLILLIISMTLVWTNTDSWQYTFFIISLLIEGILSGTGGCFTYSAIKFSVLFPAKYPATLLSGQSVCGIIVVLAQIITLAMGTSSKLDAFIYFSTGTVFVMAVQILFLILLAKEGYIRDRLKTNNIEANRRIFDKTKFKLLIKKLSPILLTMIITVGATVMVHPGVTTLVKSVEKGNGRWGDSFFVAVCTFLFFNVFDFIGREICLRWNLTLRYGIVYFWSKVINVYLMLLTSILRFIFVPLIMFCNIQPRSHIPVFFKEDYVYGFFIAVFAFSNGYLTNDCIKQVSSVGLCLECGNVEITVENTREDIFIGKNGKYPQKNLYGNLDSLYLTRIVHTNISNQYFRAWKEDETKIGLLIMMLASLVGTTTCSFLMVNILELPKKEGGARANTRSDGIEIGDGIEILKGPADSPHENHAPDHDEVEACRFTASLKRRATEHSEVPPAQILRNELPTTTSGVLSHLPKRTNLRKAIQRARLKNMPSNPQSMQELLDSCAIHNYIGR
ncbi:hypothetical protein NQ318_007584, partial [Aromia moschata]